MFGSATAREPEAGAVPAKKRLGLDDAQDVPQGRRDGSESDQGDPVKPSHARPGNRALQHGELMSEQGDVGEQRPARAKDIRHGGGEHEHGFEHGRKGSAGAPGFLADPASSHDGRRSLFYATCKTSPQPRFDGCMNDEEFQAMFDFGASASLLAPAPSCPSPVLLHPFRLSAAMISGAWTVLRRPPSAYSPSRGTRWGSRASRADAGSSAG